MIELKPCPFCGRKPSKVRQHHSDCSRTIYYNVACKAPRSKCHVNPYTPFFKSEEEAADAWNRRANNI